MEWSEVPALQSGAVVQVLLDNADVARLGDRRLSIGSHGYAQSSWNGRVEVVHRWVLGMVPGDRLIGDHINGDRLDNRRTNLRIVHASGSSQNVAGRGASRLRGVHPTRSGRWMARVKFRGHQYILGTFVSEEEAGRVADAKRRELMPFYVPPDQRVA